MPDSLLIHSGQGEYQVDFVETLPALVARLTPLRFSGMVIDRRVAALYADALASLCAAMPVVQVDASEEEKTLAGAAKVLEFMQANRFSRQSQLLAVGGGIVQDLASFSAHVYYRGIRWGFVPTTLLAMADSCIGAKCCLNLNRHKNQLGAFHAPASVWILTEFLGTLPDNDVRSGYGEIVKLALTAPGGLFGELREALKHGGLRSPQLPGLIRKGLQVKQAIIEQDEYEADLRRLLNYGHTFGHALETLSAYEVPHGLAVAWGMDLANWVACQKGLHAMADFTEVHDFLAQHFGGSLSRPVAASALIEGAKRDKKAAGATVSLVLPQGSGVLAIVPTPLDGALEAIVAEYLRRWSFIRTLSV